MIEQTKERVLQIMEELDRLSEHEYRVFETALVLFLRADADIVKDLSSEDIENIMDAVHDSDTIMSDYLKEEIDNIVYEEEEEEDYE